MESSENEPVNEIENELENEPESKVESKVESKKTTKKKKLDKKKDTEIAEEVDTSVPKEYGILVIDDQSSWLSLYKNNLCQNTPYQFKIYTANSTTRGLQLIAENYGKIHVVILDLNMPRKSGIDFLQILIKQVGIESLAVFVITSYGSDEYLEQCMFYGIRGFYDKDSINFQNLSETIVGYIDFLNRKTGIQHGIYIEDRYQPGVDKNVIYMRWFDDDGNGINIYMGETNKIETVKLPGVRTDLSGIQNFKKND